MEMSIFPFHQHICRFFKPLYSMPSTARAWHMTMSAFLEREGCETVGFEKSTWRVVIDGHLILLSAHIDDVATALTLPESIYWKHSRAHMKIFQCTTHL